MKKEVVTANTRLDIPESSFRADDGWISWFAFEMAVGWKEGMDEGMGFFVIVFFSSFDDGREDKDGLPGRGKMHKARAGPPGGGMVDFYDADDNDLDTGDSSRE